MEKIKDRVGTCLTLHNMCVSDRVVMEDVHARYNPAFTVARYEEEEIPQPDDLEAVQGAGAGIKAAIGINRGNLSTAEKNRIIRRYLWNDLADSAEHVRLTQAITQQKTREARARDTRLS